MPGGRPSLYQPYFCDDLIEHMSLGHSFDSFGATLAKKYGRDALVSKQTLYDWSSRHPEFLDAKQKGESLGRFYYENIGKLGITGQLRRITKETYKRNKEGYVEKDSNGQPIVLEREYGPASFAQQTWALTMKNRFGWKDHVEVSGSVMFHGEQFLEQASNDPKVMDALETIAETLVLGPGEGIVEDNGKPSK